MIKWIKSIVTKQVDPEAYGWTLDYQWYGYRSYKRGFGWSLRQSNNRWVLDKIPRDEPGAVARYKRIDKATMDEINGMFQSEHPTRIRE